jgi:hypothetical protein
MQEQKSWLLKRYGNARCDKCENKAIYIIAYCDPLIRLCPDHAPQCSDGRKYTELKVIGFDRAPKCFGEEEYAIDSGVFDKYCYTCEKNIEDRSNFAKRTIDHVPYWIEYWVCKGGCD